MVIILTTKRGSDSLNRSQLTSVELCAGAGGQALGLENAGFKHNALFEIDADACATLQHNRSNWAIHNHDLFQEFDFERYRGVDLLAGGLPCPPFSVAGKRLGEKDERNLFSRGIDIVERVMPRAVMFENVRGGMLSAGFSDYRGRIQNRLLELGYTCDWYPVLASDFGVPQKRNRVVMVALQQQYAENFVWPPRAKSAPVVSEAIGDLMVANGWDGFEQWAKLARSHAPTIVGGSKKHGGPDLGPSRAKAAWREMGVNGSSIAEHAPAKDHAGMPRLTVRMAARIQGFPDSWKIVGKKNVCVSAGRKCISPAGRSRCWKGDCICTSI